MNEDASAATIQNGLHVNAQWAKSHEASSQGT